MSRHVLRFILVKTLDDKRHERLERSCPTKPRRTAVKRISMLLAQQPCMFIHFLL